jgi:hypothetical protein
MASFAQIDDNGIVLRVVAVEQDFIDSGKLGYPGTWVQTSYNTHGGVHYAPNSTEPDGGVALRKNFAGKGYTYDFVRDAFIPPRPPHASWTLDEDTCLWVSPVPHPMDGKGPYYWDEDVGNWVKI